MSDPFFSFDFNQMGIDSGLDRFQQKDLVETVAKVYNLYAFKSKVK